MLIIAFLIRIYLFSRRKEDATSLDIFNILQIAITILLGALLVIRRDTYSIIRILFKSPIGWLIILYSFGVLSGLWSSLPLFSPYFGVEGLVYMISFGVILFWQSDNPGMERFAIYSSYLLIFLMVAGLINMRGLSLSLLNWHTNNYSTVAAMLFGYCFGEYNNNHRDRSFEEKQMLKRGIWISLFFVALGTSSASNISLLAGLVVVILITGKRTFKILSLLFFGVILLINQLYGDLLFSLIFPGKEQESLGLLAGRMNLWEYYFDLIRQKPWTGWGFAALSRISQLYNIHAHNSLIEITGGVGIIGLIFFVFYLISVYIKFLSNIRSPYLVGVVGAITAGLVNSNAISFIGAPTGGLFFAFIVWNLLGWYSLIGINSSYIEEYEDYLGNTELP